MKIIIFLFVVMLLVVPVCAEAPFSVITVVTPPRVNPGDSGVAVQMALQNTGDVTLNDVRIYLFLKYPFTASYRPNDRLNEAYYEGYIIGTGTVPDLHTPGLSVGSDQIKRTTFKVDVARNAEYGYYDLPYTIFYDSKAYNGKITLHVMGSTLVDVLGIEIVAVDGVVEPGEDFKVNVLLENVGDNKIKWLKLALNPADDEIVPISSDAEQVFRDLDGGVKIDARFNYSVQKDADAKNYPLNIELDYMDETGARFNETKIVGVPVLGRGDLAIAKKSTEPARITGGEDFTLTLKIENTGTGDAEGVSVSLLGIDGDTVAYLGEIEKDDYANAIFTLAPIGEGTQEVTVNIAYGDDYGDHETVKEITLVASAAQQESSLPLLALVILVVAGIFFWKWRKSV